MTILSEPGLPECPEQNSSSKSSDAAVKWEAFVRRAIAFGASGLRMGDRKMAPQEAEQYLRFIIHLFQSFEAPHVSRVMLQLVKIQLWYALSEPRREIELSRHPEAASYWKKMSRKDAKALKKAKEQVRPAALVCASAALVCCGCRAGAAARWCPVRAGRCAARLFVPGRRAGVFDGRLRGWGLC